MHFLSMPQNRSRCEGPDRHFMAGRLFPPRPRLPAGTGPARGPENLPGNIGAS
ncbi:hypothetical protein SXCC_02127 [Gluconacetobacter sp. SXCC-1]|nr:hypothetical protein SXCC_02127 [Gluconacetobacter sp. SXCC-1]